MAQPRVQNFVPLIAQKAWSYWYKLPSQHKTWIDPEDLIQDGVLFVRFCALPRFRRNRAAKVSTYLFTALDNFYKNLLNEYFTQKRNKCSVVPVHSVKYRLGGSDMTELEVRAVQGLFLVLSEASPLLKEYLGNWLVNRTRFYCQSSRFYVARGEFLTLAQKYNFGRDDLAYLLQTEDWRRNPSTNEQLLRSIL